MTTPTYSPPFLQSAYGQQTQPWQQGPYGQPAQILGPTGFEQLQQFGPGQLSFGSQSPFGSQTFGLSAPGLDQIVPSLQQIIQLLGNAQQFIWTAQHVLAQLPMQVTTVLQQPQQQYAQRQLQRPYSMAW